MLSTYQTALVCAVILILGTTKTHHLPSSQQSYLSLWNCRSKSWLLELLHPNYSTPNPTSCTPSQTQNSLTNSYTIPGMVTVSTSLCFHEKFQAVSHLPEMNFPIHVYAVIVVLGIMEEPIFFSRISKATWACETVDLKSLLLKPLHQSLRFFVHEYITLPTCDLSSGSTHNMLQILYRLSFNS